MKIRFTIRNLLHLIHGAVAILVVALAVSVGLLFANHEKLIESERLRLESDRLASELRMSSDALTQFARAYVATADPKFEQYYRQVLAIRNGEQPRPAEYHRIYWNIVAATGQPPRGPTIAVPLHRLMRDIGFTAEEFAKLRAAEADSNALVETEEIAMHAVKGVFRDATGKFSLHGEPDRAMATRILFDPAYFRQKARIMQSIDDCDVLLSARTKERIEYYQGTGRRYLGFAMGCLVVLFIVMPVSFMGIRKRIGAPVDKLREQTRLVANDLVRLTNVIRTISHGEATESFRVKAEPLLDSAGDEIGELVRMQNEMIAGLQESGAAIARITEDQKLAQNDLLESEERYRTLFEANPLPMWVYDLETLAFLEVNDAAVGHYGYSREEFLSLTIADIRPGRDKPALLAAVATAVDQPAGEATVWTHRKKNGSMIDVEITSHLLDYNGRRGELVLALDVTERRLAAQARRVAEEKFRSIFENATEGIYQTTPQGEFLAVNPAAARILGFSSPEQILNKPDRASFGYVDPRRLEEFLRLVEEQDVVTDFVSEIFRPDGSKVWVLENVRVIRGTGGEILFFEGTLGDITERTRREAERDAISEIVQGVMTTSNLDELLALAHRSIGKLLYAENCFIALHDTKTDLVRFEFWVDKFDPLPTPEPVGRGHMRTNSILRTGKPLVLTKELEARLCAQGAIAKTGAAAASWMGVPLRTPTRTIGVLAVQHYEKEDAYSQRDLEFLSSVGDQIALAIERKQAEEELKRSEDRLADAQKMAHVGSWEWDVITNKVVWSDEEYRLFGLEPGAGDASWRFYLSLVHPSARRDAMRWFNAVRAMKKSSRMDIPIVRADGEERILNSWADVVLDEGGNVVRVIGTSQDVTEREKAEYALGESEERFQLVSRATNDAIWDWDVIANSISFSKSFGTLFGYRTGEFESTMEFWIQGIHPDDHDRVMEGVYRVFESEAELWTSEYRFRCADGSYAFVYDRGYVVRNVEGKPQRMVGAMMNMTERKQADAQRERLADMVEASQDFIGFADPKTTLIQYINKHGRKMCGIGENEDIGKLKISDVHPAWMNTLFADVILPSAVRDGFWEGEGAFLHRDGREIPVSMSLIARKAANGEVDIFYTVSRDITEGKRAEAELRESRAYLQLALQASNIGPWDWDLTSNQVRFSREWKQQLGYAENEITGDLSEFSSRLHPDDAERITALLELCFKDPSKEYDVEFRMRHKDGTYRWIHTRGSLHYDKTGRPVRMLGCHLDITDRRLAEDELREAKVAAALREGEERYSFLADTAPLIIWTSRPDGCLDYYNKAWFDYTGLTLDETKDWGWEAVLHPDDLQGCIDQWTHCFTTGDNYDIEYRFKRASDGAYRWHLGRALPMRNELGEIVQWVGTCTDIDDAKRSKDMLQISNDELGQRVLERTSELHAAKEAAETANRAKSEFLANMSHEIRTPMNGIIGMTDLALETELNHDQREYLGMVKSSALSLLGLINDILDFSKIEAGMLELEAIDFSLRDCIAGMVKPLGLRADQKGLELVADISSGVPDHFVGDPMRLRQILINLTANAIKFTERGEVVVKVAAEAALDGESELHFSVADTGIGIPAEKQKAIFEAFAQADGSTTRTHGGTGLGLSIASQLIQKMHGRIWLESQVGEGTTFHFTARLRVQGTPLPAVKGAELCDLDGLRALVVDDNAVNRRILKELLLNWRMTPTVVESGQAGLDEMLRAAESGSAYQLVLLDAVMPEMDGFALAEKIHEQPELADATVMMLSSAMPAGSATRCGALGIASWLTKPVTQSELLDAILLAINRNPDERTTRGLETRLVPSAPSRSGLRILVAEDNPVNRAVATGILEKQGHLLVHAANGREAVEAFSDGAFDLILMDVQMPEMDGFEATRRIRELEEGTGGHITIAAMTAHAMAGDRERCLAAGMDDYVSKPLRKEDLLRALNGVRIQENHSETGGRFLYSREQLLSQCDGDEELMSELVSIFRDHTPEIVQSIGEAVKKRQAPALATQSHKLLSSMGAFGADRARTLALRLEKHGQEQDFDGAKERIGELERETDKIYTALADFVSTGA